MIEGPLGVARLAEANSPPTPVTIRRPRRLPPYASGSRRSGAPSPSGDQQDDDREYPDDLDQGGDTTATRVSKISRARSGATLSLS